MSQRHPIQNELVMFVTTNTLKRKPIFENDAYAREAIDVLYRVQQLHLFFLFGFVFMPDHCHLLLSVPQSGSVSTIINRFKMGVSHSLGIGPIWQSRFHMNIPENAWKTLEYIYENPVKKGLVETAEKYPWSSASKQWDVSELGIWQPTL